MSFDQAKVRALHSVEELHDLLKVKRISMLDEFAKAQILADELLSAVCEMHDALYEASQRTGVLGRRPKRNRPTK